MTKMTKMTRTRMMRALCAALPLLAALACDGDPAEEPDLVPGAAVDPLPSAVSLRLTDQQPPCGFDVRMDPADSYGVSLIHWIVTYDAQGRTVLQEGTDGAGEPYAAEAYEYEGGRDWVHGTWTSPHWEPYESWQTFDSFGRKVRYAGDDDGDGDEEWVATYENDDRGRRIHSHFEDSYDPPWIHERDYRYDDTGRLVAIDRDEGLDGTIDHTTRIAYDDVAGTVTQSVADAYGSYASTEESEYDDRNRLIARRAELTVDAGDPAEEEWSYTYDDDRLIEEAYFYDLGDGRNSWTTTYRYDGCR